MSGRRGARQTVFVCVTFTYGTELITRIIAAETPKEVLGPFFKKRTQVIENTRVLKFTTQQRRATYNDWVVDAFMLQEPADHAYLVFIKRVDDKKLPAPKGTITVPISDLRFE